MLTAPTEALAPLSIDRCRDIKPENFMLLERGDPTCVKMIDFGLSKDFSASQTMSTMSGSVSINIGDSDCLFAALLHRP